MPIWELLQEPWAIVEPIMASSPDLAGKLAPLCVPLQLNKDEFYSRKIMALYSNGTKSSDNLNVLFNKGIIIFIQLMINIYTYDTIGQFGMVEEMICTISSNKQRLEVWKWVFEKERGNLLIVSLTKLVNLLYYQFR